jgi:8-oxo-dGTP pyrophosphatase MutT (NUDIX family)
MKTIQENLRARVSAGAAIFRGDEILLLHRSPLASNPGAWDLPGGHVEPGETLPRAARREVREETGFDVRIGSLFHAEVFGSVTHRGKIRPTVGVYFHCAGSTRKLPSLDLGEHTEFAWVRASDLGAYPMVPYLERTVHAAFDTKNAEPRARTSSRGLPHPMNAATLPVPA